MSTSLPPVPSEKALSAALDGFAAALGTAAVLTSEAELAEFRDPFAHASWDEYTASAVVKPTTVEEIQADHADRRTSTRCRCGRTGRGATTATAGRRRASRGSVIVSLREMNRVLEIDEECAYAVVEPGVRWFDLYDAIQAGGHTLWLSIADLGWGSVIGNTLDHGVTYMPYGAGHGERSAAWRSCSPTGDVLRTGMGAMPGNKSWHRLQARARADSRSAVHAVELRDRHEDGHLADAPAASATCRSGCASGRTTTSRRWSTRCAGCCSTGRSRACPQIYNTICLGSVLSSRSQWYDGDGPIPDATIDHMARELEIGRWIIRSALWGDEAVVEHNFAKIKTGLRADPRRRGVGHEARSGDVAALEHPAER